MIYAVGRASAQSPSQAPRLIDIRWGEADAAQVTLVGKGVCFDTGGLNMKSSAGMKLMKKRHGRRSAGAGPSQNDYANEPARAAASAGVGSRK